VFFVRRFNGMPVQDRTNFLIPNGIMGFTPAVGRLRPFAEDGGAAVLTSRCGRLRAREAARDSIRAPLWAARGKKAVTTKLPRAVLVGCVLTGVAARTHRLSAKLNALAVHVITAQLSRPRAYCMHQQAGAIW
jgi:hypothetical protein